MNVQKTMDSLRAKGYEVLYFEDGTVASDYLREAYRGRDIGFGDSQTLKQLGLYEILACDNSVADPANRTDGDFNTTAMKCLTTDIFITSVNAISENGELVNMDGSGNRVAGSLFGHSMVIFIAGVNKIAPDLESAVYRVRNIAAPLNAKRLRLNTPCAIRGDHCYDCAHPKRICNILAIHLRKMQHTEKVIVILINENLGF